MSSAQSQSSSDDDSYKITNGELSGLGLSLPETFSTTDPFLKVGNVPVKDVASSMSHASEDLNIKVSFISFIKFHSSV